MLPQEFDDRRDADDAIRDMDRRHLDGARIIVEMAGARRERSRGPSSRDKCFNCGQLGHWYVVTQGK